LDHVETVMSERESRQGWAYGDYVAESGNNAEP
jgi:hypothetical protein